MNEKLKMDFADKWKKYFKGAELPFVFFYSDDKRYESILMPLKPETERMCMISQLNIVRRGKNLAFTKDTVICQGGLRYSGFRMGMRPNFRYFLSCGIPGKLEGERYKKTPEIVDEAMKEQLRHLSSGELPCIQALGQGRDRRGARSRHFLRDTGYPGRAFCAGEF